MSVAILIMAHGQYEQLHRLLGALAEDERFHFYIHVDAKSPMPTNLGEFEGRITWVPWVKVWWLGFSSVEAQLSLVRAAVADGGYDYYALISGVDYPIRPNEWLFETLRGGGEFIDAVSLAQLPNRRVFDDRVDYRYFGDGVDRRARRKRFPRHTPKYYWVELLEKSQQLLGIKRWRRPIEPHFGSAWWVLSDACLRWVLGFADRRRDVVRFFKRIKCPDESFVQTLVAHSPFAAQVRGSLTFVDVTTPVIPAMIGREHIAQMAPGHKSYRTEKHFRESPSHEPFFARKFSDASGEICRLIDQTLRNSR